MRNVYGANAITKTCCHHADMFDETVYRFLPAEFGFNFIAYAVAIFKQHSQTRQVVVNPVLATHCETCTKKASARKKECGVQIQDVEDSNQCDNPCTEADEVMQHSSCSVNALASSVLAAFNCFCADATHAVAPPIGRICRGAISNSPDN